MVEQFICESKNTEGYQLIQVSINFFPSKLETDGGDACNNPYSAHNLRLDYILLPAIITF